MHILSMQPRFAFPSELISDMEEDTLGQKRKKKEFILPCATYL